MSCLLPTDFASAERSTPETIMDQYQVFVGTHCRAFFDTLPTLIMALNSNRQVVFANQAAVEFLGFMDVVEVLGRRPGEAFGCVNAQANPAGCGTSRHCRSCGAIKAILAAVDGETGDGQCRLLRREQTVLEGLDLQVNATPLVLDSRPFVIFAVTDISHEMRRRNMERIFFHDVLNLAGGINGLVDILHTSCKEGPGGELGILHSATQSLVDEVLAQRDLLAAETNELHASYATVNASDLLRQLVGLYGATPLAQCQAIRLVDSGMDLTLETDARLAQRVLGNMLKNALEAGEIGDTVSLACLAVGDSVIFQVHNKAVIPQEQQESIFHRRFSTKGLSRGLGTYSMLLLTERYLHGEVFFSSTQADGTTFSLRLPKRLEKA